MTWVSQYSITFAAVASTVTAIWVLYRYIIQKDFFPRINFDTDIIFVQEAEEFLISEIYCSIENKGLVRHKLRNLKFKVHGIKQDDSFIDGLKS